MINITHRAFCFAFEIKRHAQLIFFIDVYKSLMKEIMGHTTNWTINGQLKITQKVKF